MSTFDTKKILELFKDTKEEHDILDRVLTHFKNWKRLLPKTLCEDIISIIDIAVREKKMLIEYKQKELQK